MRVIYLGVVLALRLSICTALSHRDWEMIQGSWELRSCKIWDGPNSESENTDTRAACPSAMCYEEPTKRRRDSRHLLQTAGATEPVGANNEVDTSGPVLEARILGQQDVIPTMQALQARCPGIATVRELGRSVLARSIPVIVFGSNSESSSEQPAVERAPRPRILLSAGIHGDDAAGRETVLRAAQELCLGYDTDERIQLLLNRSEIHVAPSLNPDGHVRGTRENSKDYDLDRNFEDRFDSGHPLLDNSRGRSTTLFGDYKVLQPEVETREVQRWLQQHRFSLVASFYGAGYGVVYPFGACQRYPYLSAGYCPDKAEGLARALAGNFSATIAAEAGVEPDYFVHNLPTGLVFPMRNSQCVARRGAAMLAELGAHYGGMMDWAHARLHAVALRVHVASDLAPHPSTLDRVWEQHRGAVLGLAEAMWLAVAGRVLDHDTQEPIEALLTVSSSDGQVYEARSDPATGQYYRPLPPGTFTIVATKEVAEGALPYLPQTRQLSISTAGAVIEHFYMSTEYGDGNPGQPPPPAAPLPPPCPCSPPAAPPPSPPFAPPPPAPPPPAPPSPSPPPPPPPGGPPPPSPPAPPAPPQVPYPPRPPFAPGPPQPPRSPAPPRPLSPPPARPAPPQLVVTPGREEGSGGNGGLSLPAILGACVGCVLLGAAIVKYQRYRSKKRRNLPKAVRHGIKDAILAAGEDGPGGAGGEGAGGAAAGAGGGQGGGEGESPRKQAQSAVLQYLQAAPDSVQAELRRQGVDLADLGAAGQRELPDIKDVERKWKHSSGAGSLNRFMKLPTWTGGKSGTRKIVHPRDLDHPVKGLPDALPGLGMLASPGGGHRAAPAPDPAQPRPAGAGGGGGAPAGTGSGGGAGVGRDLQLRVGGVGAGAVGPSSTGRGDERRQRDDSARSPAGQRGGSRETGEEMVRGKPQLRGYEESERSTARSRSPKGRQQHRYDEDDERSPVLGNSWDGDEDEDEDEPGGAGRAGGRGGGGGHVTAFSTEAPRRYSARDTGLSSMFRSENSVVVGDRPGRPGMGGGGIGRGGRRTNDLEDEILDLGLG